MEWDFGRLGPGTLILEGCVGSEWLLWYSAWGVSIDVFAIAHGKGGGPGQFGPLSIGGYTGFAFDVNVPSDYLGSFFCGSLSREALGLAGTFCSSGTAREPGSYSGTVSFPQSVSTYKSSWTTYDDGIQIGVWPDFGAIAESLGNDLQSAQLAAYEALERFFQPDCITKGICN